MKFLFEDELPGQVDIFSIQDEINGEQLYNKIEDKDNIQSWFDVLVPSSGKANTVAGELVRAMMRLLYRDYNDGDRFFSGYGVETCGGSAQFLIENTNDWISNKLIEMAEDDLRDDAYTDALNEIGLGLITFLKNNKELLSKPNEEDSRDWELDEQFIPKYDFDCEIPPYIQDLFDSDKYTEGDLESEIYYWEANGEQIGRLADRISVNRNTIYIDSIPEDMYNDLERNMYRWLEDFADDLYNIYGDIEDEEQEEDDYLDEALENAKYGIIETKKFNNKNFKSFRPVETLEDAKWQKDSLEKVDRIPYTIFTIEDKKKVEESLHNDDIEQHKKLAKEIGLKTLGDLKTFKDHQGSAELDALKDYKKELDLDEALGLKEDKNTDLTILICDTDYDSEYYNYSDKVKADAHLEELKQMSDEELFAKGILGYCYYDQVTDDVYDMYISSKGDYDKIQRCLNSEVVFNESLKEDTIKQNGKWVNKGKEGTHGTFKTKKAAGAQRKAMFANGFGEELKEEVELDEISKLAEEINDAFEKENSYYDVYPYNGRLECTIERGDWKHDHLYFEYFVKDFLENKGYVVDIDKEIIDESEDDSYSASYTIYITKDNLDEKLIQGKSDATLKKNIKTEIEAGKDPKQAYAIAKSIQDKHLKEGKADIYNEMEDEYFQALDKAEENGLATFIVAKDTEEEEEFDSFEEAKKYAEKLGLEEIYVNSFTECYGYYCDNDYIEYDEHILDLDKNIVEQLEKEKDAEKKDEIEKIEAEIDYTDNNPSKVVSLQRDLEMLKEDDEADYFNGEDTISDKEIKELDQDIDDLKAFADKVMKENIKPLNINNTNEEVTPIYENSNIVMEDIDDEVIVDYVNENITEKAGNKGN